MRNENRIYPICIEIAIEWQNTCPDWRFMQLFDNFQKWLGNDGFYLEDDKFMEKFKEYMSLLK